MNIYIFCIDFLVLFTYITQNKYKQYIKYKNNLK